MMLDNVSHECTWVQNKGTRTLFITRDIEAKWRAWTLVYPNKELLALLTLHETPEGWETAGIDLPQQRITSVECEILGNSGTAQGMIHSHHNMGASMSSQDKRELWPAYFVSVVTNHAGGTEAVERITLPCGNYGFCALDVVYESRQDAALEVEMALEPDEDDGENDVLDATREWTDDQFDYLAIETRVQHELSRDVSRPEKALDLRGWVRSLNPRNGAA